MTINTSRLFLRPIQIEDNTFILKSNKKNVRKYFIPFDDIESVNKWVKENIEKFNKMEKVELVIIDKERGVPVGIVALDSLQTKTILPRLWIKNSEQRKGYAKEALKAFLLHLKTINTFDQKVVEYTVDIDNKASINLAKSLGLDFVGTEIDEGDEIYVFRKNLSKID